MSVAEFIIVNVDLQTRTDTYCIEDSIIKAWASVQWKECFDGAWCNHGKPQLGSAVASKGCRR
jgi:hypothetical protein